MKIRPQVLVLTVILGALGAGGLYFGHIEVSTACVAALAAAVTKLAEGD